MKSDDLVFLSPDAGAARPMLDALAGWVARGWLREIDRAFARFIAIRAPGADPLLVLAAALASHQLGRGHACLELDATLADATHNLALPPGAEEVDPRRTVTDPAGPPTPAQLLADVSLSRWIDALRHPALVADEAGEPAGTPLVRVGSRLYLRRYWQHERAVLAGLHDRLAPTADSVSAAGRAALRDALGALFPGTGAAGPDWQKVACALAARSRFAIVTGGPGTGKTTTVVRLLAVLQHLTLRDAADAPPLRIRLAAPTGKAAARLGDAIARAVAGLPLGGIEHADAVRAAIPTDVSTVHRLLGNRPETRRFRHDAAYPLPLDVLVIDEASMLDLETMAAVLDALPPTARLVLLGDKDQLASVEAGSVLGDLCRRADGGHYTHATVAWLADVAGEQVPTPLRDAQGHALDQAIVKLRQSHRFSETSGIGRLALAVNQGDLPAVAAVWRSSPGDLARWRADRAKAFNELILEGAASRFPDHGAGPPAAHGDRSPPVGHGHFLGVMRETRPAAFADEGAPDRWAAGILAAYARFQLLCALRQGPWGVSGLNRRVEDILATGGLLAVPHGGGWYPGRPVLVTANDYSLGLMNGDVGIALDVPLATGANRDPDRPMLRVAFPSTREAGGVRWVLPSRLRSVETAFAMTVHKSQGSEFGHAALVIPDRPSAVLTRELVYTGLTRARDWFTLVEAGNDDRVLQEAITRRVRRVGGLGD